MTTFEQYKRNPIPRDSEEKKHLQIVDLRTGLESVRQAYQNYLKRIDELTETMRERGIFRKSVDSYVKWIKSMEVTQDGRLLTEEEYGRFFKTRRSGEYHLRDLTEMSQLFLQGKKVRYLSGTCERDIESICAHLSLHY